MLAINVLALAQLLLSSTVLLAINQPNRRIELDPTLHLIPA